MCSIIPAGATWGCVGVVVELQLSSYAMGWCVGFEGGFRVVLRASRFLSFVGFVAAIVLSWGNGCAAFWPWGLWRVGTFLTRTPAQYL